MPSWTRWQDLKELIDKAIVEEPPITVREGGIIKEGYNEEADRLRHAKTEGKDWLAHLEAERARKDRHQKPESQVQQGIWLLF